MDIRMPQLDGIAATRLLRGQPDPPAVLVLTTFDADELVLRALRAGAAGFLLKDTPPAGDRARDRARRTPARGCSRPAVTRRLIALVAGDGDAAERRERAARRAGGAQRRASTRSRSRSAAAAPTPRSPPSCT